MINIERIEEEVKASPSQEEKLRMIADTYGLELQIYKLIEECGELVTAAAKYDPHDYRTGYHLAEEQESYAVARHRIEIIDGKKRIGLPGPYIRSGITSDQAGGKIMRRYFELIGKRQVAQLSIVDCSPAEKAPSDAGG